MLRAEIVEFHRGDLLAGRYQVEKVIGRGATGCVVQAFDRVIRGVVAVKILRPDLAADERWVERLGGELRYARKLQHPNVCRIFDMAAADGHHFLTMEFAGGGSLRQRMTDPTRAMDVRIADAGAVIDGLVAIHQANIVHRDVKPENVLVMEDGRLVVSDFGVAVSPGQATYFSSQVAGTPSYMAPEVLMNELVTPAADVFSLGITLHEILFGRRPDWEITKAGRVLRPAVGKKAPKRERALARLCEECLVEFAPKRLANAAAVRKNFDLAVEGRLKPLKAHLKKRWPLLVGGAAIVCSAIVMKKATEQRGQPAGPSEKAFAAVTGEAVDVTGLSRPIFKGDQGMACVQHLPGKQAVRFVWGKSRRAVDIDLTTGRATDSDLIPEATQFGCPSLSPDGRRLLYVRDEGARRQIVLAADARGVGGVPLTEGESPRWLPSGEEFIYSLDSAHAAAFSLPNTRLLFPDLSSAQRSIRGTAISADGSKVAFLFLDAKRESSVEVYTYPAMSLVRSVRIKQAVASVQFDARDTLQAAVADPTNTSLMDITEDGELHRFAKAVNAFVLESFRWRSGVAFLATRPSHALAVRAADGLEHVLPYTGYSKPVLSADGDALLETQLSNGQLLVSLQRWSDSTPRTVTAGPNDLYPSFGPAGETFAFVRINDNTIVLCGLTGYTATNCRPVVTDPLGPRSTAISPDGKAIAYTTAHGSTTRLRTVATSGGTFRDLGIYPGLCPLKWASARILWIHMGRNQSWAMVDSTTGKPLGGRLLAPPGSNCEPPRAPDIQSVPRFETRLQQTFSMEVRVAESLPPPQLHQQ